MAGAWGAAPDEADRVVAVLRELVDLDDREAALVRQAVVSTEPPRVVEALRTTFGRIDGLTVADVVDRTDTSLRTVVALLRTVDALDDDGTWWESALAALARRHGGLDLLDTVDALSGAGADGPRLVWRAWAARWGDGFARRATPEQQRAFLLQHLDVVLHDRLADSWHHDALAVFDAIDLLAADGPLPTEAVEWLWEAALGSRKTERRPAQNRLAAHADLLSRTTKALTGGPVDRRRQAADWLARLRLPEALPPLEKAVAKEKQVAAKAALLGAIEALGEPIERHLGLDRLVADAEATAVKGWPEPVAEVPWDSLPGVRWAGGEVVPTVVLRHLATLAVKAKTAAPDALLRRYAAAWVTDDRRAWAHGLLAWWCAEDDRRFEDAYAAQQMRPARSMVAGKGLLALVAACGGPVVAARAEDYVRTRYGLRAAESKAMVTLLAWLDEPAATQAVLSIAARFRTKGIQDAAAAELSALAERRGWTVDELADRTVPDAGFGTDGTQVREVDGGTATVVLLPDATVDVRDGSVPAKELSALRRELKKLVAAQADRLHGALYAGRTWRAADWTTYVAGHPVVRLPARGLVWTTGDATFRLLDDGTLSSVDDAPVVLADDAEVRLAHDTLLDDEQVAAWLRHLADHEVAPPFVQLGRGRWTLPDDLRGAKLLDDVEGHVVSGFRLRSTATRLGWVRGEVDGGWFQSYDRVVPTLGLHVCLTITDTRMPVTDDPVALLGLRCYRVLPEGRGLRPMPLGDVPEVLLGECRHDLLEIAATGIGFDPDWRRLAP